MTNLSDRRLREELADLVADALEDEAEAQGVHLDGRRDAAIEAVVGYLLDGDEIDAVSRIGEVALAVVDDLLARARQGDRDWLLDLVLQRRHDAGLERELPRHVAGTARAFGRIARRGRKRRRW